MDALQVNGSEYRPLRLLGKGKGGYSWLVTDGKGEYVLKQLHHEPCDYYTFGDKLASELRDYATLEKLGVPMPRLLAFDRARERILKEHIPGRTVAAHVARGTAEPAWTAQAEALSRKLAAAGLNIDWFPANFIPRGGRLRYVDYECSGYMEQWDFEHWGRRFWEPERPWELVVYVHGRGGSAEESAHYAPLFPGCAVRGVEYVEGSPREAAAEVRAAVEALRKGYDAVTLVANSIGAYLCMRAGLGELVRRAWFIFPIVDMPRLICDMLRAAGETEETLRKRGTIPTAFGETLSGEELCFERENPPRWPVPTAILYGGRDLLTARETVEAFARDHGAALTVMEDGEHWFHTPEQMAFLDRWIRES